MSAESLSVYWGLFGSASIPVEIALNHCGMCHYCFSDLNSPARTADIPQIMGLLSEFRERKTMAAQLLQQGYPVVLSNHSDAFSSSNEAIALPIIELMAAQEIPIVFQTKARKGAYKALDMVSPSVWYITLTTLDEDVIRRVEPGAPSAVDRLAFMAEAVSRGHRVLAGINPAVEEWIGDPYPLCRALKQAGAEGVWVQPLHLSNNQLKNMPNMGKAALGEEVIRKARLKRKDPSDKRIYEATRKAAVECGLEIMDLGQKERSDFFKPYKETYARTYPTFQDFVNYCYDTGKGLNDPIYWSEYRDFMLPQLPEGVFPLRNHLGAVQYHHFWREWDKIIPKHMDYEMLLLWSWKIQKIVFNPVNLQCFAWAAQVEEKDGGRSIAAQYLDDDDLPILLFRPEGTKHVYENWAMW